VLQQRKVYRHMSPAQVQREVYRVSFHSVKPKHWWALGFWS